MTAPVVICTSAFGADSVHQYGQRHFIARAARAGADGIEIREELFTAQDRPYETLGACVRDAGLFCIYSSTLALFVEQGRSSRLNEALSDALAIAEALDARFLKVSLGQFPPNGEETGAAMQRLGQYLAATRVKLLVENDQTLAGGRIAPLRDFFTACRALGIELGMTFDVGNWHWIGNDPREAAHALGDYVAYVHCKGVVKSDSGQLAARVPTETDLAHWAMLWQHFDNALPRAIEFPLVAADDAALIAHARHQTRRLKTLAAQEEPV